MKTNWTLTLEEDPATGDLMMPFPPDLLNQVGWDLGDVIIWEDLHNGTWGLKKQDEHTKTD